MKVHDSSMCLSLILLCVCVCVFFFCYFGGILSKRGRALDVIGSCVICISFAKNTKGGDC